MELLLLAVVLALIVQPSENLQITVQPDEVSTVTLSTTLPLGLCSVCELTDEAGASAACTSSLEIGPRKNVTMQFNCSEPQNAFSVLIWSQIECKKTDCSPAEGNAPASLLSEFNRTFEWKLNAPAETTLVMNFPEDGLKMVAVGEDCTDGYSYSVSPLGSVQAQSYCKNGPVSRVELPNQATVSVLVPQQQAMDVNLFTVTPNLIQQKGHARSVTPDPNTVVIISRKVEGSDCAVCMGEGSQICDLKLKLVQSETTNVIFNCTKPQDVFNVEIIRDLDCSKGCNYDTINPDWSFFPDFNRTFTWDMKVALNKAFQIDFPTPGMRQIKSPGQCPDKHTYTILMYPRTGTVNLGTFCQNGSISRIQILWRGRMTLEVPRDTTMSSSSFRYSTANGVLPAVVGAVLPRGQSDTDFYSANNIPVDYKMSWNFEIPPKHNFTVQFLEYIKPECQGKQAKVIYEQANKDPFEKALSDDQPSNYQGNFNLTVANCDVVKKNGLSLNFRVSVFRGGLPEMCEVDLRNNQGLSLKIEKKDPNSFCELRMDSVAQEKIIVPSGSKAKLSFLDCFSDELLLTATKTIECQMLPCPEVGTLLTIPSLDSCIPTSLNQVVWELRVPEQSAVKLSSSQGTLHQSVPGQESECIMSVLVSETDGSSIGRFCSFGSRGIIQSFQISSNITVTAMADGAKRLSQESGPFITASFGPEIKEKMIYTIFPLVSTPAFLMTPNWPGAMKSDSTISWIINVPDEHSAELNFLNVSWPQCDKSHANIAIQESGSENELGFREDELLVPKHSIPRTFYLNMSNCEPEKDYFAVLSKVSLQKDPGNLLGIILGVVGALLAALIIALIAVCVVVKKKKNQTGPRSSIYIPKGIASLPGDVTFPKTRVENDSRVYETIDDTMVYTHLLQQDGYTEKGPGHFNGNQKNTTVNEADDVPDGGRGPEKDTYRPFLAPMDTFMPSKPRTPLGRLGSMDYEDRRMVDNELYTFKNTGDINTISLSAVEPLPLPEPEPFEAEYDQAM